MGAASGTEAIPPRGRKSLCSEGKRASACRRQRAWRCSGRGEQQRKAARPLVRRAQRVQQLRVPQKQERHVAVVVFQHCTQAGTQRSLELLNCCEMGAMQVQLRGAARASVAADHLLALEAAPGAERGWHDGSAQAKWDVGAAARGSCTRCAPCLSL